MRDAITFTVPETTTARFVVATDRKPRDITGEVRERLTGEAPERLGTPRLTVTVHPAADSPWDLSRAVDVYDGGQGHEARVRKAAHHIGVTAVLPVADQPYGGLIARAAAQEIAECTAGVPVDADTGQIVPDDVESRRFVLADEWLGSWLPPYRNGGRCTAAEEDVDGCACVGITTRGLGRFGLPELQITGVSCSHDLAALNVLRTTAQRLLSAGVRPGSRTLSRDLVLTSDDFAAYWGTSEPMWSDGPVPVRLTAPSPRLVRVGPPTRFPGTLNEWLWDELPPVLYELLSCAPDPID